MPALSRTDAYLARDLPAHEQKLADCEARLAQARTDPDQAWKLDDLRYEHALLRDRVSAARAARARITP